LHKHKARTQPYLFLLICTVPDVSDELGQPAHRHGCQAALISMDREESPLKQNSSKTNGPLCRFIPARHAETSKSSSLTSQSKHSRERSEIASSGILSIRSSRSSSLLANVARLLGKGTRASEFCFGLLIVWIRFVSEASGFARSSRISMQMLKQSLKLRIRLYIKLMSRTSSEHLRLQNIFTVFRTSPEVFRTSSPLNSVR
jgi:hypothetical protein